MLREGSPCRTSETPADRRTPGARDVYEEGALIFPCVQVQRDYEDVADIIRMCRKRIRVPTSGTAITSRCSEPARVGERRLGELAGKHGAAGIRAFVREWLDYSERRMEHAIRQRAAARIVAEGRHDPFPALPGGLPLKVIIDVDPKAGTIKVVSATTWTASMRV